MSVVFVVFFGYVVIGFNGNFLLSKFFFIGVVDLGNVILWGEILIICWFELKMERI